MKFNKYKIFIGLLLFLLCITVAFITGCGNNDKVTADKESKIESTLSETAYSDTTEKETAKKDDVETNIETAESKEITVETEAEHSPEIVGYKAPMCTSAGSTGETVCLTCGEVLCQAQETAPTGHSEYITDTVAATCTSAGYTGNTYCSVCNVLLAEGSAIPIIEHKPVVVNAVAATCNSGGYTGDTVCEYCNVTLATGQYILPSFHPNHEIINQKDRTCTEEGYTGDSRCLDCGVIYFKGYTQRALGHSNEFVNYKKPTKYETGYTGDYVCKRCGEVTSQGYALPRVPDVPILSVNSDASDIFAQQLNDYRENVLGISQDMFERNYKYGDVTAYRASEAAYAMSNWVPGTAEPTFDLLEIESISIDLDCYLYNEFRGEYLAAADDYSIIFDLLLSDGNFRREVAQYSFYTIAVVETGGIYYACVHFWGGM